MHLISFLLLISCLADAHNINRIFNNTNILKEYAQQIEAFLKETNASPSCKQQFKIYRFALLKNQLWAFKMFDACSKFPSGLLLGTFWELGTFDECLNVEHKHSNHETIIGKYCLGEIALPKDNNTIMPEVFQFAICAPNGCSANDLRLFYKEKFENLKVNEDTCQSKETQPKLNGGSIAAICFFVFIFGLVVISTSYEAMCIYYFRYEKQLDPLYTSFSILTNGRKLFHISKNSNEITCLYGLRTLCAMSVVLQHGFTEAHGMPSRNWFSSFTNFQNSYLFNKMDLVLEIFFLTSGIVVAYGYLVSSFKGIKFDIIMHYTHRYLRLTPTLIVAIIIELTLTLHFGSGPIWKNYLHRGIEDCKEGWWRMLLYVQNYKPEFRCVPQAWYLSVDMQLFLLSPIFLISLSKWPKLGKCLIVLLTAVPIILSFCIAWHFKLHANKMRQPDSYDYLHKYYLKTYTRGGSWLIGILVGYYAFLAKQGKMRIKKKVRNAVDRQISGANSTQTCLKATFRKQHFSKCYGTHWVKKSSFPKRNFSLSRLFKFIMALAFSGLALNSVESTLTILDDIVRAFNKIHNNRRIVLHYVGIIFLWILALAILLTCYLGGYHLVNEEYNRLANSLHIALVRPAWTIAMSWVILACIMDCSGPVNWFLSLPIFKVLSKLTFTIFLTHLTVFKIVAGQMRVVPYVTVLSKMHEFWGNFIFTVAASTVIYLAIEAPFATIQSHVLRSKARKID